MSAIQTANISEYIENLPLGFETKIGSSGTQMSGGQKQKLLIARAVYKNPRYIYFLMKLPPLLMQRIKEIIYGNLNYFFKGKTVLIIVHRLSTVKNADQIVVMKTGRIVEIGCHRELIEKRGEYFELIKNQLELSSKDLSSSYIISFFLPQIFAYRSIQKTQKHRELTRP